MFKYMNMRTPQSSISYGSPASFFKSNSGFKPKKASSITRTIPPYRAYSNMGTKPINKTYIFNTRRKPRTTMSAFFSGISTTRPSLTREGLYFKYRGGKRVTKRTAKK